MMASYTKNLNLLKKDPVADANDTFNIQTMLNDNFDKLDAAVGAAKTSISTLEKTKANLDPATGKICLEDLPDIKSEPVTPHDIGAWTEDEVLDDTTRKALDLSETALPRDAFLKLCLGGYKYGAKISVKDPFGNPMVNATIIGLTDILGQVLKTNSQGAAFGVTNSVSTSLKIVSPYFDWQDISQRVQFESSLIEIVNLQFQIKTSNIERVISTKTIKFSPKVQSVDIHAFGGGGGGACGLVIGGWTADKWLISSASGAGGGQHDKKMNFIPTGTREFECTIGAGGQGGSVIASGGGTSEFAGNGDGLNGGITSVRHNNSTILQASGGCGGESTSSSNSNGAATSSGKMTGGNGGNKGGDTYYDTARDGLNSSCTDGGSSIATTPFGEGGTEVYATGGGASNGCVHLNGKGNFQNDIRQGSKGGATTVMYGPSNGFHQYHGETNVSREYLCPGTNYGTARGGGAITYSGALSTMTGNWNWKMGAYGGDCGCVIFRWRYTA